MDYNGEARPRGGIATPVDGCDRQFRRGARCDIEPATVRLDQAGARRLEGIAGAYLVDRKIAKCCSAVYCAHIGRGPAQRAAAGVIKNGDGDLSAAVSYTGAVGILYFYGYRR